MRKTQLSFVALLLLVLMVSSVASAKVTTLKYWLWLDDPTDRTVHDLIDEFNSLHPDINVVIESIPLNNYYDQLLMAISAGAGPDAARFKDWWLGAFHDADLLENLDPYIAKWPHNEDVIENLWTTGMIPGVDGVFMMPHQFITFYMYYRADWLEEAGLTPPRTFDEFLEACKVLTDPANNRYGFGLRGGGGGQDQWLAFMVAGGARIVDEEGNIVINSEKAVEVNQWYIDLFRELKVAPPSAPTDAYAQVIGAFQAGNTAMMAHHVGSSVMMTDIFGDKVGVLPIPVADPENPATMGTMSGNVVFSTSEKKDAAFKFISWLSEAEPMDKWSKSRQGQLPVLKSVAAQKYYTDNDFFRVSLDGGDYAVVWPPLPGVGYVASFVWQNTMQRALLGEITSKQMLDEIAVALREGQ